MSDELRAWNAIKSGQHTTARINDAFLNETSRLALSSSMTVEEQRDRVNSIIAENRAKSNFPDHAAVNAALATRAEAQRRVEFLSLGELRDALRDASDVVVDVQRRVAEGENLVTLQQERVSNVMVRLGVFGDLKTRIVGWTMEQRRSGREDPMPPDLVEGRAERERVQEELDVQQRALNEFARELSETRGELERASVARDRAAIELATKLTVVKHASDVEFFRAAYQESLNELVSLVRTPLPLAGTNVPIPAPQFVVDVLQQDVQPKIDHKVQARFRDLFLRLMTDPDATLEDEDASAA